jgi:two-component system chemotaxis sensor kinase CheA
VDDLIREFLIESHAGLDQMERCLTELEERPADTELLANIFRSVHTIKGTTGFLGYARLESLSHAGENLLGLLRDGKLVANAEIISALLDLLDGLRAILASIETEDHEGTGSDEAMVERLVVLAQIGARPQAVPKSERIASGQKPSAELEALSGHKPSPEIEVHSGGQRSRMLLIRLCGSTSACSIE